MKKINLDKFICENMDIMDVYYWENLDPELKQLLIKFAKQLLELAAENIGIIIDGCRQNSGYLADIWDDYRNKLNRSCIIEADKQSILDTINQIE